MVSLPKRDPRGAASRNDRLRSPRQEPDTPTVSYAVSGTRIAFKDGHFTGSAGAPSKPSLKVLNGRRPFAPEAWPGSPLSPGSALGPPAKGFK
jgi:hypothetical protein